MNKRKLYYLLSPKLRRAVRRLYYLPADIFDFLTGKRDKQTPPKGKIFVGSGDFKKQGKDFVARLIKYAGLMPNHRVLDIGCGIGRAAIPLTKYINEKGSYEGFDIVKSGIKWCKKNISKNYPNFNFKHIDLKNDLYNLSSENEAKKFVFPYKNNEFDVVFLFSVFSHMLPEDVDNYLSQINRVLIDNGVCYATFFILNDEVKAFMQNNNGIKFLYDKKDYALHDKNVKEANVAYKEPFLKKMIEKNNFEIEKIMYGYWSGREKNNSSDFQDTLILKKKFKET